MQVPGPECIGEVSASCQHGYRQRVGLGQALIHQPPILILDEPTSDLDPNEKAEVIKYIKEIGKSRTILLSTLCNLAGGRGSVPARAIIVSKGRVVADGPLDEIRGKTGSIRYFVTVDEKGAESDHSPPKQAELEAALKSVKGADRIRELPTDEKAHKFEVSGSQTSDLRADIFRLMVQKGWTLLELRRDAQSLDAVFRELTRGDERLDRGADWNDDHEDEDDGGSESEES